MIVGVKSSGTYDCHNIPAEGIYYLGLKALVNTTIRNGDIKGARVDG